MTNNHDLINRLLDKLNTLLKRQDEFQIEISLLRDEIDKLKTSDETTSQLSTVVAAKEPEITGPKQPESTDSPIKPDKVSRGGETQDNLTKTQEKITQTTSNLEKFIGENLANKIGIVITVIGVSIGVKYAIDHELISPLIRIILGYLGGLILLGFAIRLKKDYENYSSVLLSGSMAIMYFITYAAYDFYELIPMVLTYTLMVIFTIFSVVAAIHYNRQVIAHIGLVGSYAIPFLLDVGLDNNVFLFSFMTIINTGILVIAFNRNWKPLFISAFSFTWLIYSGWFVVDFSVSKYFVISLTFLSIFFVIFYLVFLGYKLLKSEKFMAGDVLIILVNSFIFFGFGYRIIYLHSIGKDFLGLFAIINAIIHFAVSIAIYRNKLADRNLFYLVSGLVLVFITIAIPIQMDGHWVTLLWAGEAALLFWIGRSRKVKLYENLSYPVIILAFISIIHFWSVEYGNYYLSADSGILPLLNINLLTSLLFIASIAFINYLNFSGKSSDVSQLKSNLTRVFNIILPAMLLIAIFYAFRLEIADYWNRIIQKPIVSINDDYNSGHVLKDYRKFKSIWLLNYSLLFVSALSLINLRKIRSRTLSVVNLILNVFFLMVFLTHGLYILSELRESYLNHRISEFYSSGNFHLLIRYVTCIFAGVATYFTALYVKEIIVFSKLKNAFELALYLLILWISSSELIHWMDVLNSAQSYKFGLSIFWGIYALALISLGIMQRKKHLRIGAIVLFGGTLLKLFFYDVSHLLTLPKTIIFILLGVLLLIISFLYNKYKHIIFDESDDA